MPRTDEELYAELSQCPDFLKFPLPEHWYKKFNIPRPSAISTKQFLQEGYWVKCMNDPHVEREIRTEPVPGGVRPLLEVEQPAVEVITRQIGGDSQQETTEQSLNSIGSNEKEHQKSSGSSTIHEQHDEQDNGSSSPLSQPD